MASFTRLSFENLLPFFSWTRQREVQRRSFLQMQVMSTKEDKLPTVTKLIISKDEDPHELSYTSLRDLLSANRPASPIKPKRESAREDIEEDERPAIKNRLVELAARAYLLPSHAQATPANEFFSRQWARFSRTNWLQRHHSEISLSRSVSCLPGTLWMNITRAFCSLFKITHLRPQPLLQL